MDGLTSTRVRPDITPQRGSIAGGTLVEIIGRGFHEEVEFTFEDRALEVVEVIDAQTVWRVRLLIVRAGYPSVLRVHSM